jgi:hypothetical protein
LNEPSAPVVVSTEAGQVTLLSSPELQAQAKSAHELSGENAREAKSLRDLAESLWTQRGKALVSKIEAWSPSPELRLLGQQAMPLLAEEEDDDRKLESIRSEPHSGAGRLFSRVTAWNESRQPLADKAQVAPKLNPQLSQIGRQAPAITIPEADSIGAQAIAAEVKAEDLEKQSKLSTEIATSADGEVQRRTESEHEMGFDALYLAAYLQTYGPQPVENPLVPKRGELAYLSVPATLARQQTRRQWVGGSQGFSFPIGHTGIRYRVGSFRGHPVEQQFLNKLGPGTLVVTNQRIAFIGSTKSLSVLLTKLLHVECYSDAVAVFQEGRENPDFYFVGQPKLALFWINWALDKAST